MALTTVTPSYILNINEKVMLGAFIRGTQINDQDSKDPMWTKEALQGLQDILDEKPEPISSELAQDLSCIFLDLIIRRDPTNSDTQFTKIMVKFMHHLITIVDWTSKRRIKGKPGPKPQAKISFSITAKEGEGQNNQEIPPAKNPQE